MKRSDLTGVCSLAPIFLCLAIGIDIPMSAAQGIDRPTQRSGGITKRDSNKAATSAAAEIRPTTVASASLIAATAKRMNLQLGETFCTLTPRQLFVAGKGYLQFLQSNVDPESNEALLHHSVGLRIFLKPSDPGASYLLACTVKKNEPATFEFRDEPYEFKNIQTIVEATSKYRHLFFVARAQESLIILRGNYSEGFHFYSCVITNLK